MNPRFPGALATAAIALSASGCMSVYRLPAGTTSTLIEVPAGVTSWICDNSEPRILTRGRDGKSAIPTGRRVVIGLNFASSDGYMNYYCSASASLEPNAGYQYLQDFVTEGNYCSALVYRKAPEDKRIGLALEPTLGPDNASCVYKKK
jgi:hypothetical protein